jgi:Tol biopolymer transport system component/DNA-binding winged helix-turn-helix (wHTH) protein
MYRFGEIDVDAGKFQVRRAGQLLELEPKAIRVLTYLLEHRGRVVPKDELIEKVWDGIEVTDNALTRVVGQLRKALGDEAKNSRYIETMPTIGYRFIGVLEASESVETAAPNPAKFRWGWALGLGLFLVAVAIASLRKQAYGTNDALPPFRQITSSRTLDTGPALSPDGKLLAYSSDRSGQFEIYVRPLDGQGKEIQITSDGGPNVEAAWSPDGKWIAYHCVTLGGICMTPATGGSVRILASPGSQPNWSPDSKRLVYREAGLISLSPMDLVTVLPYGLAVLDIETGAKRSYQDLEGNRSVPVWSADGQSILYSSLPFLGKARIEAMRLDDGSKHKVLEVDGLTASLRLSSDGKKLFYSTYKKPAGHGVHWVEMDPVKLQAIGAPHDMSRTPAFPMQLEVSRDGRKLILAGVEQDSNLFRLSLPGLKITPLTNNRNFRNTAPVISPDGRKVVYAARQLGNPQQIWIIDADGSNAEMIGPADTNALVPAWKRDGSSIFYRLVPQMEMEELRLADRTRKRWPISGSRMAQHRATGRGEELLFHELDKDQLRLGLLDAKSGDRRMIPTLTNDYAFAQLSPDGTRIVAGRFQNSFTHLALVPVQGGNPKQFGGGIEQSFTGGWSADGKRVAFAGLRKGSWNLYTLDVDSEIETKLTSNESLRVFVRYPMWSPQSDWIVFERTETTGNLFSLDLPTN